MVTSIPPSSASSLSLRSPDIAPPSTWPRTQTASDAQLRVAMSCGTEVLEGPAPVVLCTVMGKAGVQPSAFVAPDPGVYANLKGDAWMQAQRDTGRKENR
jgi:hypothetical protein